ncbi:Uracil-DNA glycosylase [Trichinella britovi]|uniref:Uracil-DNA glycosylase n=1 Tax=Trichinella britovi TaxID=45882 RepID=A0A0V1CSY9_TRIBR|nr:Uracil-DNA glycosylase [Trichinella britovi]
MPSIRLFSNFQQQCYFFLLAKEKNTPSKINMLSPPPQKQLRLDSFFSNKCEKTATTPERKSSPPVGKASDSRLEDLLLDPCWKRRLGSEFSKAYFKDLENRLNEIWQKPQSVVFPPKHLIFNAFNLTPLKSVKAVILGQDPYHNYGQVCVWNSYLPKNAHACFGFLQAHGLSFSVPRGVTPPPSLKNIFKELADDIPGFRIPSHGCLTAWAKRGVLLLNASLTVECHKANSHAAFGWQDFTDFAIKTVSDHCFGVVFLLWGAFAHKKERLVDSKKHTIIKTAHPSPLSQGRFFGCRCFSKTNEALKDYGKDAIDWTID